MESVDKITYSSMMAMKENILLKNNVVKIIRDVMNSNDFVEVNTPLLRKGTNPVFKRHEVDLIGSHSGTKAYLRDSMECALRSTLQFCDRIFEIGTVFRLDLASEKHYPEFTLFELYALSVDLNFLMEIASKIICESFTASGKSCTINKVSVKDYFQKELSIDISNLNGNQLKNEIIKSNSSYSIYRGEPHYQVVNKFIEEKIESIQGINILYDYPACTISTARKKTSSHVIERFELFINGLEICNAYLDETDIDDMINRCLEVSLYNYEEKQIVHLIDNKSLSPNSGGLGIGIERLCCAISNLPIENFMAATDFNFMSKINH